MDKKLCKKLAFGAFVLEFSHQILHMNMQKLTLIYA